MLHYCFLLTAFQSTIDDDVTITIHDDVIITMEDDVTITIDTQLSSIVISLRPWMMSL